MKKVLCVFLLLVWAGCACAGEADPIHVGFLSRMKTTPEEFYGIIRNAWATKGWAILGGDHSVNTARFYESLMLMQMALNRDEIEEMILPDFVAEYLLKENDGYAPSCVSNSGRMSLCFGFMKDNRQLADKWNAVLNSMRNEYMLAGLGQKYIRSSEYDYVYGTKQENSPVKFERFANAPTVRVAITGDLPPGCSLKQIGSTAIATIEGTPTKAGTYTFTINATSSTPNISYYYGVNAFPHSYMTYDRDYGSTTQTLTIKPAQGGNSNNDNDNNDNDDNDNDNNDEEEQVGPSRKGGSCNSGFSPAGVMLLALMAFRKSRK